MMSRSPKQRFILLLVLSALVLALGIAVAVTFVNSTTWGELRSRLTGVYPAPSLGMTLDRELKVIGLVPGSAAESKGVRIGDVVYAVNREPISSASRVLQILEREQNAASVRLGLVRHKNKLDVIVQPVPPPDDAPSAP